MEQLICPTCGTPSEDGYCPICLTDIPTHDEEASDAPTDGLSASGDLENGRGRASLEEDVLKDCNEECDAARVACSSCGTLGDPGRECMQCGAMLPMASTALQNQERVREDQPFASVSLVLPGGMRLSLNDGRDYLIGRESDIEEIRRLFVDNRFVSRHHCILRADRSKGMVLVRDEASTNGTFVGESLSDRRRICGEELLHLPATIWLGSRVQISICGEVLS